jgi:hypothetical protein
MGGRVDNNTIFTIGRVAGLLGILLCIGALVARVAGQFYFVGVSVETLLQGGTTGVVIGSFLLLLARSGRT